MEAKTTHELWNDRVEGHSKSSYPREGQVTSLCDSFDSPTPSEVLVEHTFPPRLFEDSGQELEISFAHQDIPEDLGLLGSPKAMSPVMPEPTCLTEIIAAMKLYPPPPPKVPRKVKRKNHKCQKKKSRRPGKMAVTVSDNIKVESEVEEDGIVGRSQESCQSEQPATQSTQVFHVSPEDFAHYEDDWDYPNVLFSTDNRDYERALVPFDIFELEHIPTEDQELELLPIENLFRIDDYYQVPQNQAGPEHIPTEDQELELLPIEDLFNIDDYYGVPRNQAPSETEEMIAKPSSGSSSTVSAPPLVPAALEQGLVPALVTSNEVLPKERSASSNLSPNSDKFHGPQFFASQNIGLENEFVEIITTPAPPQNKRRRLVI